MCCCEMHEEKRMRLQEKDWHGRSDRRTFESTVKEPAKKSRSWRNDRRMTLPVVGGRNRRDRNGYKSGLSVYRRPQGRLI